MTPQDQIKAIAELDGWQTQTAWGGAVVWHGKWKEGEVNPYETSASLPPYLTSRDAIIGVIEKQSDSTLATIAMHIIAKSPRRSGFKLLLATPQLLAEALLRATNKWKD